MLLDDVLLPVPPSSRAGKDEVAGPSDADTPSESTLPADRVTASAGSLGFTGFVPTGLCTAVFLLVIASGALVVRYAKLAGRDTAYSLHRNLQLGVSAFASSRFSTITPCSLSFHLLGSYNVLFPRN